MNINKLKGKKIGITAFDLQKKEHRGIANYTKNLIKVLSENKAEVYIITDIGVKRIKENKNESFYQEVAVSDILNIFQKGDLDFKNRKKNEKIKYIIEFLIRIFFDFLFITLNNFKLKYKLIKVSKLQKALHISEFKSDYLNYISGFIVVNGIFNKSLLRSFRYILRIPQLNIKKNELDLVITSCPLSVKNKNKNYVPIVQIIHDAIPIQDPDNFKPLVYLNTLKDAHSNKCLYVSSSTKNIICNLLQVSSIKNELDILRPIPSISLEILKDCLKINSILEISKPFILLNSSIVSWKKIEKAIYFFNQSNLSERGFSLCIAGQIHNTNYSNYIKTLSAKNKSIFLLGYVSEFEKAWLYLNSSLLISTSSTEGFGIPVLDAGCLNIPVIASKIASYHEIQGVIKNNKISLYSLNEEEKWLSKLNQTEIFDFDDIEGKKLRIKNYEELYEIAKLDTDKKILNLLEITQTLKKVS